ncbi:hypothetical protein GWI33_014953 [Rhynchophorus ferrugineus]|uniref:Uncharacterized protein n=1 Tax=Rhynchophorus ferrugineus TaxID=354439 RepID=A0A834I454_RHYFE|nr:hypothetical protein GWI33_014953 [Rhynchophorus ferrugineus]
MSLKLYMVLVLFIVVSDVLGSREERKGRLVSGAQNQRPERLQGPRRHQYPSSVRDVHTCLSPFKLTCLCSERTSKSNEILHLL